MNCKVCGKTSARNASISFFRFPKDNSRCKIWADRCDLLELLEKHGTLRFYKSFRICSEHFDPKDVVFDGRKKRLVQSAIPQISLRSKNKYVQMDEEKFKFQLSQNLCRLCAKENENLTDIFGCRGKLLNLEKKLKHLPQVINESDVLPLKICHECLSKVDQFYDFVIKCTEAETKLRAMIKLKESKSSYQHKKSNVKCDKKVNVNSGPKTSLKETPKFQDLNDSTAFPENPNNIYDYQLVKKNSIIKNGSNYLFRDEVEIGQASQVYNCTNLKEELDVNKNNSFQQDYSEIVSRPEFKPKVQTNQSIIEETSFACDVCMKSFMNFETLNKHSLTHSPTWDLNDETLKNICDTIFYTRSFQISQEFKNKVRLKRIVKCERTNSSLINEPNSSHSKSKKWSGGVQERLIKNTIPTHPEITEIGKTHRCNECRKFFRSKASLRQHRAVHSEKRSYSCQECGVSFKRKDTLCNHVRIHTGERPFVCKVCGFAFKQRGDCVKHERNHEKCNDTLYRKKILKAESQLYFSTTNYSSPVKNSD